VCPVSCVETFKIAYLSLKLCYHTSMALPLTLRIKYIPVKISGEPDSRVSTKTDFHNDLISVVKYLPKLDWIKLLWIVVLFLFFLDREVERENRCVRRCRG
jgi:hypothetical protein